MAPPKPDWGSPSVCFPPRQLGYCPALAHSWPPELDRSQAPEALGAPLPKACHRCACAEAGSQDGYCAGRTEALGGWFNMAAVCVSTVHSRSHVVSHVDTRENSPPDCIHCNSSLPQTPPRTHILTAAHTGTVASTSRTPRDTRARIPIGAVEPCHARTHACTLDARSQHTRTRSDPLGKYETLTREPGGSARC